MDEIRANSDSWTGRDPGRAAPRGMSRQGYETRRKFLFALGCFCLVLAGFQLALIDLSNPQSLAMLAGPLAAALIAFSLRRQPFSDVGREE